MLYGFGFEGCQGCELGLWGLRAMGFGVVMFLSSRVLRFGFQGWPRAQTLKTQSLNLRLLLSLPWHPAPLDTSLRI